MAKSNIRVVAYRKYQCDWLSSHGYGMKDIFNLVKEWLEEVESNDYEGDFQEYMEEFGFNGCIYACYEEFLEEEFFDRAYMKELLTDKEFFDYTHDRDIIGDYDGLQED